MSVAATASGSARDSLTDSSRAMAVRKGKADDEHVLAVDETSRKQAETASPGPYEPREDTSSPSSSPDLRRPWWA